MANVHDHYQHLLAQHYTWMLGGDIEQVAAEDRRELERLGVDGPRRADAVAMDLGSGPGPQSLALADLGFSQVIAVDLSQQLLDELHRLAQSRPAIRTVNSDLVEALGSGLSTGRVEVVVCMRDTVLHLPDHDTVTRLFERVAEVLQPEGVFVLTYRDLTRPLHGPDRFIPVRSDHDKIMLCALDHQDRTVTVTDLVYTRGPAGWDLHKSSYPKLQLDPGWLGQQLERAGFHVDHHDRDAKGVWSTVARKPRD